MHPMYYLLFSGKTIVANIHIVYKYICMKINFTMLVFEKI